MATEAETTHAILRNARAQERERLRNLALTGAPHLTGDDLDTRIRELEVAKLSEAGRKGRATQHEQARVGRAWIAMRADVEDRLETLLAIVSGPELTQYRQATPATPDESQAAS